MMESILEPLTHERKIAWQGPPVWLQIASDELHFWLIDLENPARNLHSDRWLSNDEKARAFRLVSQKKRNDFISGRSALRLILARYLNVVPDEIKLDYSKTGKPFIAGSTLESDIRFNLSHSGRWMLLGICEGVEVGVDIEKIQPLNQTWALGHLFSEQERNTIRQLQGNEKDLAFFSAWTKKEALAKASGKGLSGYFTAVQRDDPEVIQNLFTGRSTRQEDSFRFIQFEPAPGFLAAAAVEFPEEPSVRFYEFVFGG